MSSASVLDAPSAGLAASDALQLLVGPSPAAAHLWGQIRRVAPHFRTALLTGERASGADAVARALHDLSPAMWRPFAALAGPDAEAYLANKPFANAPLEGTLFVGEVENLSRAAQAGLLRALRHRGPHGIRVVASARTGLRPAVSAGLFSAELASALSALRITLPALRERPQDIPLLVSHLLHRRAQALGRHAPQLTADFLKAASTFDWPGNLEQMSAVLDDLIRHSLGTALSATDLEQAIARSAEAAPPSLQAPRMVKLEQVVQEHIRAVLFGCNGNKLRAAEILGISRSTLYRMLDCGEVSGNDFKLPLAG